MVEFQCAEGYATVCLHIMHILPLGKKRTSFIEYRHDRRPDL